MTESIDNNNINNYSDYCNNKYGLPQNMSLDPLAPTLSLGFVRVPEGPRDWTGSADELAELANTEILRETGVDPKINERLIRYYVTMGVIDRPRRIGKEAQFAYRQFTQLFILRNLLDRGLSLSNVRQYFTSLSWDQVDGGADQARMTSEARPSAQAPTPAQLLVESFKKETRSQKSPPPAFSRAHSGAPAPMRSQSADSRHIREFRLPLDCRVQMDEEAVRRLTPEAIRDLAEALNAALLQASGHTTEGKQP